MRILSVLAALLLATTPARAATGPWVEAPHAKSRLVGPAKGPDGAAYAAIEIVLEPGWKTYWRSPGEAGQAPDVRAQGGKATLLFPAPKRYEVFGLETIGYQDRVLFPLRLDGVTGKRDLDLQLRYDICKDVCIPVSARHRLMLDPADGRDSGAVLAALSTVPAESAAPKGFGGSLGQDRIRLAGLPTGMLFVEGPEGLLHAGKVPEGGRLDIAKTPSVIKGLKGKWIVLTLVAPDARAIGWRTRF